MALGELLIEETGTITNIRVLPAKRRGLKMPHCYGELRGSKYTTNWTYTQTMRNDGSIIGGGDGVMTTECGNTIYLKGSGSATGVDSSGTIPLRLINHYHTLSEKFADLNGIAVVGEYDVSSMVPLTLRCGIGNKLRSIGRYGQQSETLI